MKNKHHLTHRSPTELLLSAGVQNVKVGDAVFGLAPGCFGPAVVLPAELMVSMPPGLSFMEAATLPTVFVTVYAAFGDSLTTQDKVNKSILAHPRKLGFSSP